MYSFPLPSSSIVASVKNSEDETTCCWETNIGQELYKLTLTHLLADLSNIVLVDGGRWVVSKMNCCRYCRRFNAWFNKWVRLVTDGR